VLGTAVFILGIVCGCRLNFRPHADIIGAQAGMEGDEDGLKYFKHEQ
jgi:hypothetical protein